jgi:hypothetical protein
VTFSDGAKKRSSSPSGAFEPVMKKSKEEAAESDEDSEEEEIRRKLQIFQSKLKKSEQKDKEAVKSTDASEAIPKKKAIKPSVSVRVGWSEPEHRLMVFNHQDAQGCSKVRNHFYLPLCSIRSFTKLVPLTFVILYNIII